MERLTEFRCTVNAQRPIQVIVGLVSMLTNVATLNEMSILSRLGVEIWSFWREELQAVAVPGMGKTPLPYPDF